jgi:regulator of protease activity HflC (stomatin/prohibitin superfamily)
MKMHLLGAAWLLCGGTGCATVVEGHERALFYSAGHGIGTQAVGSGWHWHLPWNSFLVYDLRWVSHKEEIHIHSKDGLHMNIDVVVVVRPDAKHIYDLDTDVGPNFYDAVVRPAVYGAVRDASGRFTHLEIATETHQVERAIHEALLEHLRGQHLELGEVAIQHFDLPAEVEQAANRKAAANQLVAAKEVELHLAERDAQIEQAKRRGVLEAQGLEKRLRAEQELAEGEQQVQIAATRRRVEREKAEAEADNARIRAQGEAAATRVKAEAERTRIAAQSQNLSANYVRIAALEALGKALGNGAGRTVVLPVGKDGLPAYFAPFLDPYSKLFGGLAEGGSDPGKANKTHD